jgi:hypothetical protein
MSVLQAIAAVIDDVVERFENSVRQPVLAHELPDIFLAVEFGCAWRKLQERDVVWNLEGQSEGTQVSTKKNYPIAGDGFCPFL